MLNRRDDVLLLDRVTLGVVTTISDPCQGTDKGEVHSIPTPIRYPWHGLQYFAIYDRSLRAKTDMYERAL